MRQPGQAWGRCKSTSNQVLLWLLHCMWPVEKAEKEALSGCSPRGCVCSRLWIVPPGRCVVWERAGQSGAFLSQRLPGAITHTYCLLAGEHCCLLLPRFSPQLTFWPINLPWTRSQSFTSQREFGVYEGFDITWADRTPESCCSYERLLWNCPCESHLFYKNVQHSEEQLLTHQLVDSFFII